MNRKKTEAIMEKIISLMQKRISGEQLYLLAFLIYLTGEVLATTMFPIPGIFYKLCRGMLLGLIIWKIIIFDYFQLNEMVYIGIICVDVLLVKVFAGYSELIMWALLLVGAKNVSFEKILKIYFIITSSIIFFAFSASLLEVIVNLQYSASKNVIRNSFGIVYPTDFAAHIFFLMLVFLYLRREKIKIHHYIVCMGVSWFVFRFCHTRLDVSCMCFLIVGYMFLQEHEHESLTLKRKYRKSVWLEKFGRYSMPVAMILIMIITDMYDYQNTFMFQLNRWMSERLYLGKRGLTEYGIHLFGQYIEMVGNGGSTVLPKEETYFFIDCSYLNILLRYGSVFFLIVLSVYVICCRKYQKDRYFVFSIAMISLNCMVAHHLIEIAYNPFALALFAEIPVILENDKNSGVERRIWRR